MEELFKKIEDNIFGTQENNTPDNQSKDQNESTKESTIQISKNEKDMSKTETKNSHLSKIILGSTMIKAKMHLMMMNIKIMDA